jgi:hypothetical protein
MENLRFDREGESMKHDLGSLSRNFTREELELVKNELRVKAAEIEHRYQGKVEPMISINVVLGEA